MFASVFAQRVVALYKLGVGAALIDLRTYETGDHFIDSLRSCGRAGAERRRALARGHHHFHPDPARNVDGARLSGETIVLRGPTAFSLLWRVRPGKAGWLGTAISASWETLQ
jgi:hypothetical protein